MDTGVKEVELRDLWRRYKDQGDDTARERLLVQASEMLAEDVGYIPLYSIINSWASKKSVIFEPRPDQFNFAASARPAAD